MSKSNKEDRWIDNSGGAQWGFILFLFFLLNLIYSFSYRSTDQIGKRGENVM